MTDHAAVETEDFCYNPHSSRRDQTIHHFYLSSSPSLSESAAAANRFRPVVSAQ